MNFCDLISAGGDYEFTPVNFYHQTFESDYKMEFHSHRYYEIMYAEQGKFVLNVKKPRKTESVQVGSGQFVLLDSNVIHNISVNEKCRIYNFEILPRIQKNGDFSIKKFLLKLKSIVTMFSSFHDYIVLNDTRNILSLLKNIHFSLNNTENDRESEYLHQLLTLSLFISVGNCYMNNATNTQSIYVTKMLKAINDDLTADLSPVSFSKTFGVSPSYLHRLFKQCTNTTITKYVNGKRIEYAKSNLRNTNAPIMDIAVNSGFNSRQNFCSTFKKITGISPIAYRKKERQKEYNIPVNKTEVSKQKTYSL